MISGHKHLRSCRGEEAAVLTNALQVLCLVIVAIGAVAGVARDLVQTNPALAYLGAKEGTLVHICVEILSWA